MVAVWFITGSSRGLGKAITEYALASGDKVVATARKTADVQHFVDRYGPDKAHAIALDVTDYDAADAAAKEVFQKFGRVDILVNNAGWSDINSVEDMSISDFRRHIDVNFFGVVNVTKAFLPHLRQQGSGHIFQIGSIGGRIGTAAQVAYQSAKWAINGFSTGLSAEISPFGIKVTVLEPGGMLTDFTGPSMKIADIKEHYKATVGAHIQLIEKSMASPPTSLERVAKIIKILSEEPEPPLRLLVGSDAVWVADYVESNLKASDEKWKHLSVE